MEENLTDTEKLRLLTTYIEDVGKSYLDLLSKGVKFYGHKFSTITTIMYYMKFELGIECDINLDGINLESEYL